jgi:mono/diheme cytochrome c family protein
MTRKTAASFLRSSLPVALLFLLLVLSFTAGRGRVSANPSRQSADDGGIIFQEQCVACHTVGQGDGVGPDLKGVTTRPGRDSDWLTRWISAPDELLAQGDPLATELLEEYNNVPMPNLGLSEAEVASLIAFLETQQETEQPEEPPEPGDASAGKNLFTGVARLSNGGPSCRACHSSGGIGGLGGGKLGPDLTDAYANFGDALITWPSENSPSQTMRPIFESKPLTAQEKADLLAFFESADVTQRSTEVIWQLVGLAVAGVLVFAGLAALVWRRRLRKVRQPMVTEDATRTAPGGY